MKNDGLQLIKYASSLNNKIYFKLSSFSEKIYFNSKKKYEFIYIYIRF